MAEACPALTAWPPISARVIAVEHSIYEVFRTINNLLTGRLWEALDSQIGSRTPGRSRTLCGQDHGNLDLEPIPKGAHLGGDRQRGGRSGIPS